MTDAPDAGLPAPSESEEVNLTEPNTPAGTAPDGVVETKQAGPEKTFTQAELDAAIQKRLLKEERRVHRRVEQQYREQAEQQTREVTPKRESFGDDEAYFNAQIEHLAEKKAAEKIEQRDRQSMQEKTQEAFLERAETAKAKYADFDAIVSNPRLTINDAMAEFISDSDSGPDIAYFLGKNPTKAADIASLSPIKAARELARLEVELSTPTDKPKPRPSNAPAPIAPIGGTSGGSKSPAEMTDSEYAKWRRTARK